MSGDLPVLLALVAVAVVSGLGAWLVDLGLLRYGGTLLALDKPNARSLHAQPVPRGGGLGIVAMLLVVGVPAVVVLEATELLWSMFLPLLAIALVSYIDDRRSLPAWPRLCVHALAAGWFVLTDGALESIQTPTAVMALPSVLGTPLTILLIVWLTNLYNFMDGIDGLAGGMGVFGFTAVAVLAGSSGDWAGAAIALATAGSAMGFLALNFPPARLFLGDVGSSVLGFLCGALIVRSQTTGAVPVWVGLLVFAPFVIDASVTIVRRAIRRERIWEAHRSHYYQRFAALSAGHRRPVLLEYVLMIGCALSALAMSRASPSLQWVGLAGWGVLFVVLMWCVARYERACREATAGDVGE